MSRATDGSARTVRCSASADFHPLRIYSFEPVHGGGAERNITAWSRVVARAARSCEALRRVEKVTSPQLAALVATGA